MTRMLAKRYPLLVPLGLVGVFILAPAADGHAGEAQALMEIARGEMCWDTGDLQCALEHFGQAIEQAPDCSQAQQRLGLALFELGRREEAIAALERAVSLAPERADLHLDLALAYLAQQDLFWASDELAEASRLVPDDPRTAYFDGLVLLNLGEVQPALDRLRLALSDPRYREKANYHLGMALAVEGDSQGAREHLDLAAGASPDSPHGRAAREAVNLLIQQEWDTLPFFSARLALEGQYDSNVVQEPLEVSRPLGADAPGLELSGSMTLAPWSTPVHRLYTSLSASRIQHFASPPDQFNHTGVSLSAGYRFRFAGMGHTHALELRHRYDLGMLDGGELTDVEDFYAFREANTVTAQYTLSREARYLTVIELRYRNALFADMRRNSDAVFGRLAQTLMFLSERLKLLLSAGFRYEQARGDGYDLWGLNGSLGISALGPWSLELLGIVRMEHNNHFNSGYYYGWGAGRRDDAAVFSLSVARPVWEALLAELAWVHTEHRSTTASFDYRRDLISLAFTWVFL